MNQGYWQQRAEALQAKYNKARIANADLHANYQILQWVAGVGWAGVVVLLVAL